MELITSLLLSIFIAIVITENYGYGYWMFSRPVFGGFLVGLLMGDLQTGLLVGGTIELMYIGVLPIGGSVPPNAQIAGMLSTVFAISNGGNAEVGIALALPIGVLAQLLIMLAWNINILLMHRADKYIQEGDIKKVERTHLLGIPLFFTVFFIASFFAIYFGSDFVNNLVIKLPEQVTEGLKVASGLLPAVGMAMLIKMMNFKKYWSLFTIGFVLAVYFNLSVLAVSILSIAVVCALYTLRKNNNSDSMDDDFDEEEEEDNVNEERILTKRELRQVFRRSFFSMTSINYERYCSLGFCYAMIPAIKKLYKDEAEIKEALKRHNEFFNCHPYTGNAVLGVTLTLEEQRALNKPISEEAISSTKTALMGPLSGIGDSVFKAVFMTIFAAIGAGMAIDGNVLGPFVFLIPNVLLNVLSRKYFVDYGYKFGTKLISKMKNSNIINTFVEATTFVGMMIVGAMVVGFVKVPLDLVFNISGSEINILNILNGIVPSLLPVSLVLVYYLILKKYKKGMYIVILLSFIIGILGKIIGIF